MTPLSLIASRLPQVVRYTPVRVFSISPSSGPASGETRVRLAGNHSIAKSRGCDVREHGPIGTAHRATLYEITLQSRGGEN